MTTPRITFFVNEFAPGGVTEVTTRLCAALASAGIDLRVMVAEGGLSREFPFSVDRWSVETARKAAKSGRVIVSTSGRDTLKLVRALGSLAPRSVLHVQHVPLWMAQAGLLGNIVRLIGAWWCFRRVLAVFTVSRGIAAAVVSQLGLPASMVWYVPNAVLDDAGVRAQRELSADSIPPRFVFVGRLHYQKDISFLLKAFSRVVQRVPAAALDIIGDGPERNGAEELARLLGLEGAVRFLGWRAQDEIRHISRDAAAVVLSSRWEGLPTVLVELGAEGVPFIARDCATGPAELLEGAAGGIVTPFGDIEAFAVAIAAAAESPLEFRRKHRPSAHKLDQFSAKAAAAEFLSAVRGAEARCPKGLA